MSARRAASVAAAATLVAATVVPALSAAPTAAAAAPTYYRPMDGVLHLAGHGYGHGHGLSQWGAYGGAKSGVGYRQILAWYYNSPAWGTATGNIKVQITGDGRGTDGSYDTRVRPAPGATAADAAGHSLLLPAKAANGTAYDTYRAVLLSDGSFRVQAHAGSTWTSLAPSGTGLAPTSWTGWVRLFRARTATTGAGAPLTLVLSNGTTEDYRETLELDHTSGAAGVTVNRLSIEHYLLGVVPSEMPCSWTPTVSGTKRLDGLEAQAVAARSYAGWRRLHPRSSLVDIVDSTSDQAYHGYSAERTALSACPWTSGSTSTSAAAAAVAATNTQVLVDSARNPIFAQYSASNGGYETAGSQSYLPSRPDAWDGVPTESWNSHSWTDSVTAAQIEHAYPSIGSFASLTVNARESLSGRDQHGATVSEQWGGRITQLTLSGSAGSVTTSGASFQGAMGLMSPWFTIVVARPGAPRGVSATAGDAQATVRWSPPSTDGGGGIRSYRITASPAITPVTVSAGARSATITGLSNDRSYVFSVAATNTAGTGSAASAAPVTPSMRVVFHPLRSARVVDTRSSGGAIAAGSTRSVKVLGVAGVPTSGVAAVALDVTSVGSTGTGSLSVFPHGFGRPATAQVSWPKGQTTGDLVWVKVGSGGYVDLAPTATTHALVDVEGYYTAATSPGGVLTATAPTVLFDSRTAVPAGATRTVAVVGRAGVPSGATGVVVQVTAVRPATVDTVAVWPTGSATPRVPVLFAPAGRTTDATAVLGLNSAGSIVVAPRQAAHLVVTLLGWFTTTTTPAAGVTSLVTPTKRVITLTMAGRATTTVASGRPPSAGSAIVTVTVNGPAEVPVSVWAAGASAPVIAQVHALGSGLPVARTFVVRLGNGGAITVHNGSGSTIGVAVAVAGWIAA